MRPQGCNPAAFLRDGSMQLVALSHDERDLPQERFFAPPRHVTQHGQFAGCGVQQARKHFERRRLACAIGAEKADDFAGREVEREAVHGLDFFRVAMHQACQRGPHTGLALADKVGFAEIADVDRR